MLDSSEQHERLILDTLMAQPSMTMERLVALLPHMTWNRVFEAIDVLSRTGRIRIQRRGFDYELRVAPETPAPGRMDSLWSDYVDTLSGSDRRTGHLPKESVLTHGGN